MSNFDFEFESQDPSKEQDFGTRSFWENGVDNDDDDAGVNFEGTFGGLSTFSPVSASKSNQDFENQDFEMEDKQSFQNVAKSGKKQGYDSDSDIDADFAGGWDNAKNEAPFSDYETTNKFEYSTKRGDDMESFDGFDQSEPNDERFGSEFDKVSRKTGKRRMDSGNMSNVKSEFGSWKDAVEIDQRPVNDRDFEEEETYELPEKFSTRGVEKKADLSNLFGKTEPTSVKKEIKERFSPIPKAHAARKQLPQSPVLGKLGSILEEKEDDDRMVPTPRSKSRRLNQESKDARSLSPETLESPFRKPYPIKDSFAESSSNRKNGTPNIDLGRRSLEARKVAKMDEYFAEEEETIVPKHEEIRKTGKTRASPLHVNKQISRETSRENRTKSPIDSMKLARESPKAMNQKSIAPKKETGRNISKDTKMQSMIRAKPGSVNDERVLVDFISARQADINGKMVMHKAFVERSNRCTASLVKALETVMQLGEEYKDNLSSSTSDTQRALLKVLQDLAETFEPSSQNSTNA